MTACARCGGTGWICEAHPTETADHDPACSGPAEACPACQPQSSAVRPRLPDDWQSFIEHPVAATADRRERLFEFMRASDGALMSCELRFHGESYGWEVQFLERGELLFARGGFTLRRDAIAWAQHERAAIETGATT
jgi:hypothetical protein